MNNNKTGVSHWKKNPLPPFLCLLPALGCWLTLPALFAQEPPPAWYMNKEISYPSSHYIAGVGEGAKRSEAEAAAVAAVSMFFNTKTEVRNEMIREFNEAAAGSDTEFSKKTYIVEGAQVRSSEELLGLHFAQSWHDAKRGQWAALAYIDRQEAAAMYDSKIQAAMRTITALAADAAGEAEPLYGCALLYRGLRLAGLAEELIKSASLVTPPSTGKYTASLAAIQQLRSDYRRQRDGLVFTVRVEGPDFQGRIERKLAELLEANGYVVAPNGGAYSLAARLAMPEETLAAGVFVRPGIAIRVEREGRSFFSYNKNYQRFGQRTVEGAHSRALAAIEQDLEENFIGRFTAMLGR